MEFRLARTLTHAEVDGRGVLTFAGLFNHLQEIAIAHAEAVGAGAAATRAVGAAWVLHKLAIRIGRWPRLGETVEVATWLTGAAGSRAFRSFALRGSKGEWARASCVWVYLDVTRRAPRRIDPGVAAAFTPEPGPAAVPEVDDLKAVAWDAAGAGEPLGTRYADFDGNDHVNNAAYADLLQTLLDRRGLPPAPVRRIGIVFLREAGRGVTGFEGLLMPAGEAGCRFALVTAAGTHACGEVGWENGDAGNLLPPSFSKT